MARRNITVLLLSVLLVVGTPITIHALSSPNYIIDEDFVGGGGSVDASSPNYRSQDSIGAPAVGDSESVNNQTQSGATTTSDPMLEFSVDTTSVAFGSLLPSLTRTGTVAFSVRNYTSSGYVVQAIGTPPSNGAHTLSNMSSATGSSVGTEQFGMNVVANTAPVSFGADPLQVPSGDFSYGMAATGYNTTNVFKYVPGDVIARANESSGRTDYTISYIANVSATTPGGTYMAAQSLICTGTY